MEGTGQWGDVGELVENYHKSGPDDQITPVNYPKDVYVGRRCDLEIVTGRDMSFLSS